jgi:large subunit ribosomal protein L17
MRHNKKINHLGRTHSHREAMLSNMAVSLIKHKRIFTTLAKAKALRKYVEPLITKCKEDTTHSRRVVFRNLRDKYAVTELFQEVSQKIGDRPGGYTRIIKTGNRLGDNASMCFIELVDYNELMLKDKKAPAKAKTRRSRRKSDAGATTDAPKAVIPAEKAVAETPVEELPEVEAAVAEEATEVAATEQPVAEETPQEIPATETVTEEIQSVEPVAEETSAVAPEAPAEESVETEKT